MAAAAAAAAAAATKKKARQKQPPELRDLGSEPASEPPPPPHPLRPEPIRSDPNSRRTIWHPRTGVRREQIVTRSHNRRWACACAGVSVREVTAADDVAQAREQNRNSKWPPREFFSKQGRPGSNTMPPQSTRVLSTLEYSLVCISLLAARHPPTHRRRDTLRVTDTIQARVIRMTAGGSAGSQTRSRHGSEKECKHNTRVCILTDVRVHLLCRNSCCGMHRAYHAILSIMQ